MQITIDNKLKLLAGLPIEVEDLGLVHPLKLKEIIEYGYSEYLSNLNVFAVKKEQMFKDVPEGLNEFDVLLTLGDLNINLMLKEALSFFLKDEIFLYKEKQLIIVGTNDDNFRIINRKNFMDLRKVIQVQNYLISADDIEANPKNEKAKEVKERLKKSKEEVNRIKKKEDELDETDFFDMLSAISSKSNCISKIDVMELTIFQIYEEFKRLNHIDQYETGILALLQGAKNVKLKHWSSKISL
jgi:hypothetical protein